MDYKVLVHFLNHETGAVVAPGDGFETKDKDVIKLLLDTGYIEKVKAGKGVDENVPTRKSKKVTKDQS